MIFDICICPCYLICWLFLFNNLLIVTYFEKKEDFIIKNFLILRNGKVVNYHELNILIEFSIKHHRMFQPTVHGDRIRINTNRITFCTHVTDFHLMGFYHVYRFYCRMKREMAIDQFGDISATINYY